uniref:Zinc finger protein n=1 Tax=Angiostrongylus cantonensis TaxID=6313 RepID=A0A0K0DNY7_ANGCA
MSKTEEVEMSTADEKLIKPDPDGYEQATLVVAEQCASDTDGFWCDRCGKAFTYSSYRENHLKYTRCGDNGDKKFPCTICPRSFDKRYRLRVHTLVVHENYRPHVCSICGRTFSQKTHLTKHKRSHSGERPYKCSYCTRTFTDSSVLCNHLRRHTGEKPFKCTHCDRPFASHGALDGHIRLKHVAQKD